MALTNHQQEKLDESLNILKYSDRLRIQGSAGVGKTYMVDTLISILAKDIKSFQHIYCSAPTNKAVSVLKNKVKDYNNLQFITTHAALKLKRNINYKTGNISFQPSFDPKYPPLKNVKLFIIDEASMVNEELLGYIEEHAIKNNCKVIFIGDNKQINPVHEEDSPVFIKDYPEVELTEIVRQGVGNPIINLSRNLSLINNKIEQRNEIGGYIYSYDEDKVIETLAKVNGTDELKYLAYTNVEVDKINKKVREKIYGNPNKIEINETLIFNSPYKDNYFTNQEILVEKIRIFEQEFQYLSNKGGVDEPKDNEEPKYKSITLKCYSINPVFIEESLFSKEGWIDDIIVVHEDSEKDFDKLNKLLKDKAKFADINWRDYFEFIEQFADLTYNHALTVHKSQGSTYEQVIVNIKNLNINQNEKEKKRLLYTAVTRASKLLILYKV
jgi:exodeoxyribonuclease-5